MQPVSERLRTLAEERQAKKKAFVREHALSSSRGKACSIALGPEPADCSEDERLTRGTIAIGVLDTARGYYVSTLCALVPLVLIIPHSEGIPGFVLATILSLMAAFILGITKARVRAYQVASMWIALQNSATFRESYRLNAVDGLVGLYDQHSKRLALSFVFTAIILAYLSSKNGMLVASAQLAGAALAVYGVSAWAVNITALRLREIIDAASWRSVTPGIEDVGALAARDFQYWSERHDQEYLIRKGKFATIWQVYIIVLSVILFVVGSDTIYAYYYVFVVIFVYSLWGSGLVIAHSDIGGGLFCRRPPSRRLGRALSWVAFDTAVLQSIWFVAGALFFISLVDCELTLDNIWHEWPCLIWFSLYFVFHWHVARFFLEPCTLAMIKTAATAGFRVVVFRRFSSEAAKPHRLNVMPVAGAFGVVAAIADETLGDARPHFRDRLADALAGIEEISPKRGDNWLEYVEYELRRADLVLFHWPDDAPTASMRNELDAARRYLPSSRLLWITPPDKQDVLRR